MPYIVTVDPARDISRMTRDAAERLKAAESRRAVATLDEARFAVGEILNRDAQTYAGQTMALPESGGTVGPLPDGTVIEVEQVTWHHLHSASGAVTGGGLPLSKAEIIDAYNAAQGNA